MEKLLYLLSCSVNSENLYLQKLLAKSILTSDKETILQFVRITDNDNIQSQTNKELYDILLMLSKLHLKHSVVSGNLIVRYDLIMKIDDEYVKQLLLDYSNVTPDYSEMKFIVDELNEFISSIDVRKELTDIAESVVQYISGSMKTDINEIISFLGSKYLNITSRYIDNTTKNEQIIVDKDVDTIEKFSNLLSNRKVISTGYKSLDNLLNGGFESSRVYIFAGKPGHGKSAFLLNLAHNMQLKQKDKYVVYITLENDELETIQRLSKIVLFDKLEIEKVQDDYARSFIKNQSDKHLYSYVLNNYLREEKVIIKYFPPKTQVNVILSWLMSLASEVEYSSVCLDYASLLRSSENYDQMRFELGQVILDLKQVSRELNMPVVTAVQLNTAGYDSIPTMKNIDESRQIAQNADFIGLFYDIKENVPNTFTFAYYDKHTKLGINIDKNRNGPRDKLVFSFYYDYLKFLDELTTDNRTYKDNDYDLTTSDSVNEEYYDETDLMDEIKYQTDLNSDVSISSIRNNSDSGVFGI